MGFQVSGVWVRVQCAGFRVTSVESGEKGKKPPPFETSAWMIWPEVVARLLPPWSRSWMAIVGSFAPEGVER